MDDNTRIHKLLEMELPEGLVKRELTVADIPAATALESEAYADNPALLDPSFGAARRIMQMSQRNIGGPKLSFKAEKNGTLVGYIIAYESRYYHTDGPIAADAQCIFVADVAVRDAGSPSGARVAFFLIRETAMSYKTGYFDKGNWLPLVMSTREQTSRKLLYTVMQKFVEKLEMRFEVIEKDGELTGLDLMYRTILIPIG